MTQENKRTRLNIKRWLALLLIPGLIFLPGCWGKREVEELAPLIGVGFDLGSKPGTFLVTMQMIKPKQTSGGGAEIDSKVVSVEAASARESVEEAYKLSNLTPFMGSLRVIVIGDAAARAGFYNIIDFGQRFSQFRRTMYMVLTKGTAKDLLNTKLRDNDLSALTLKSRMENANDISTYPAVRLGHFLTVLARPSSALLIPVAEIIKSGDQGVEYNEEDGSLLQVQEAGVLKGDRLVDYLTDEETKGSMWLQDSVYSREIDTAQDSGGVSFGGQILNSKTKYSLSNENGIVGISYDIKVSASVDEVMGFNRQASAAEWAALMNQADEGFSKIIQGECQQAIKKERELGLDFLEIGRRIEERDPAYWKTIKDQWNSKIADVPISLKVEVSVHHSGMSNSSAVTN